MSIWNNVRWNWSAAAEAAAALRRAANQLEHTIAERSAVARYATAEWRGHHRNTFDERLNAMLQRSSELADEYRRAAARIEQASQWASDEQARRERARERERERERERRDNHH